MSNNNQYVIEVSKELQKIAEKTKMNLTKVIEDKLLETYKENIFNSYEPRSEEGSYVHTGTFLDSIYTKVEDDTIMAMIADIPYENSNKSAIDVYTYLEEGTKGGGDYGYKSPEGRYKICL